jgi:hypothetical protein
LEKNVKILLIITLALVTGVSFTTGILINQYYNKPLPFSNNSSTDGSNQTNLTIQNTTSSQVQATWHEVSTIKDPTEGVASFKIKGTQCKIVISATPNVNYDISVLTVDLFKNATDLKTATISWSATESPSLKEDTMISPTGPGYYEAHIMVTNLKSWKIKVYDYY